jgi:hypothetical protein
MSFEVIIKDVNYERVYKFTYLGSLITEDNERAAEIKERLAKRNVIFHWHLYLSPEVYQECIK